MNRRFLRFFARLLRILALTVGIGTAAVIFMVGAIVCLFFGLYLLQHRA